MKPIYNILLVIGLFSLVAGFSWILYMVYKGGALSGVIVAIVSVLSFCFGWLVYKVRKDDKKSVICPWCNFSGWVHLDEKYCPKCDGVVVTKESRRERRKRVERLNKLPTQSDTAHSESNKSPSAIAKDIKRQQNGLEGKYERHNVSCEQIFL